MATGGVLFDIDGVLTTSWQPIPGAADVLQLLDQHRIACSYLTNTTTRTCQQIAAALSAVGLQVPHDSILTAVVLTADYVRTHYPDARCFLVNNGDISDDMAGINIITVPGISDPAGLAHPAITTSHRAEKPDVIVLGGAGPQYSHHTLSQVYEWMTQDIPVVAMHRNTLWATSGGMLIDIGMYLLGMEQVSGRQATAVGKPSPTGFLAAAARLGVKPEDMCMIGDDLNNDVLAAQAVGMTGVLVRTGKFRQDTLDRWAADKFAMQPNHIIDSVADLPTLLGL